MQIFKMIESLLGPFWAILRESLVVYQKKGQNDLNFLSAPTILPEYIFSYQNIGFKFFYLKKNINFPQKNILQCCTGCQKIFSRFKVAIF